MSTSTPRLLLVKPIGTENYSVSIVDSNLDIIDAAIGATICTSATRPATGLFDGRLAYETDTDALLVYKTSGATWRYVNTPKVAGTTERDALTPKFDGLRCYRKDTDLEQIWNGSAWLDNYLGQIVFDTGELSTVSGANWASSTKVDAGIKGTFTVVSGGIYEADIRVHGANAVGGNYATVGLIVKSGGLPGAGDTQISACSSQVPTNNGVVNLSHKATFAAISSGTYGIGLFGWIHSGGAGTGTIYATSTGFSNKLMVKRIS